jgi:hypothetical protein
MVDAPDAELPADSAPAPSWLEACPAEPMPLSVSVDTPSTDVPVGALELALRHNISRHAKLLGQSSSLAHANTPSDGLALQAKSNSATQPPNNASVPRPGCSGRLRLPTRIPPRARRKHRLATFSSTDCAGVSSMRN